MRRFTLEISACRHNRSMLCHIPLATGRPGQLVPFVAKEATKPTQQLVHVLKNVYVGCGWDGRYRPLTMGGANMADVLSNGPDLTAEVMGLSGQKTLGRGIPSPSVGPNSCRTAWGLRDNCHALYRRRTGFQRRLRTRSSWSSLQIMQRKFRTPGYVALGTLTSSRATPGPHKGDCMYCRQKQNRKHTFRSLNGKVAAKRFTAKGSSWLHQSLGL